MPGQSNRYGRQLMREEEKKTKKEEESEDGEIEERGGCADARSFEDEAINVAQRRSKWEKMERASDAGDGRDAPRESEGGRSSMTKNRRVCAARGPPLLFSIDDQSRVTDERVETTVASTLSAHRPSAQFPPSAFRRLHVAVTRLHTRRIQTDWIPLSFLYWEGERRRVQLVGGSVWRTRHCASFLIKRSGQREYCDSSLTPSTYRGLSTRNGRVKSVSDTHEDAREKTTSYVPCFVGRPASVKIDRTGRAVWPITKLFTTRSTNFFFLSRLP